MRGKCKNTVIIGLILSNPPNPEVYHSIIHPGSQIQHLTIKFSDSQNMTSTNSMIQLKRDQCIIIMVATLLQNFLNGCSSSGLLAFSTSSMLHTVTNQQQYGDVACFLAILPIW